MLKQTRARLKHKISLKLSSKRKEPAAKASVDAGAQANEGGHIVERPDGYHWLARDGRLEFGPFDSLESAQVDSEAGNEAISEEALAPTETLHNIEREMDLADWIDPETGALAEGASPPHLNDG